MSGEYFTELKRAMDWLGTKSETLFIGQAVACSGTAMSTTLVDIKSDKLLELPVAEEMQMGMTLGFAMNNITAISIFPRWNFLLCAINQLVNHIDKYEEMNGQRPPTNIIIRTSIGSVNPLDPQAQHKGDFSEAVGLMCSKVNVVKLDEPDQIFDAYRTAFERRDHVWATICVEYGDYYNSK